MLRCLVAYLMIRIRSRQTSHHR